MAGAFAGHIRASCDCRGTGPPARVASPAAFIGSPPGAAKLKTTRDTRQHSASIAVQSDFVTTLRAQRGERASRTTPSWLGACLETAGYALFERRR